MALVSYRCANLHHGGMTSPGTIRAPDLHRARV